MDKSVFEGERGGIRHRYEIREDGLHYSAGKGGQKAFTIAWQDFKRLEPGRQGCVYLVRRNNQSLGIWLSETDMPRFLEVAVAAWGIADKETARKAAFDYGSVESYVGWIWLALTIGFPGFLSAMLLADGYHERSCNALLAQNGQMVQAEIVKTKKNRRGNFAFNLEFETAAGQKITGKREGPVQNAQGESLGRDGKATVIYAPENLKCWDISLRFGERALNDKQRHFTVLMDLSFGWAFALVGALGVFVSIRRILRKHPHAAVVRAAGEAIR